jgi:Ala-tRNA(Pro) deacylase
VIRRIEIRRLTMPILKKLREYLDANGVRYEVRSHPQAFTANAVAAAEHVPRMAMAKVVVVRSGAHFLMTVLPAAYRVDLKPLRREVGKVGLHLATEEEFAGLFPECAPGAMPPFGNLYGIPVWVDEALTKEAEIVFNAGNHEQTVHMAYGDFARLVQPKVASFAEAPDRSVGG